MSHRRSLSRGNRNSSSGRSASPPSQTYHPSIIPHTVPTPALVESVAGGAHYSGARVDSETAKQRRASHDRHQSHTDVSQHHSQALDDLNELFCSRPTRGILDRTWDKDAVFEDPLSQCKGFNEYTPQWFGLAKLFPKSKTLSRRVLSSTSSPNRLIFSQSQEYTMRWLGTKKVVDSIVVVDFDEAGKIVRLVDQWGGKDPPTGFASRFLRRTNAKVVPWFVRVPKNDIPSQGH